MQFSIFQIVKFEKTKTKKNLPPSKQLVSSAFSFASCGLSLQSLQEGLSQVTFSWKLPSSTSCSSRRYDCYSADNGLFAAGAKTEIDVLAIQRASTDTSIRRCSESSLRGCFDGAFSNRAQSRRRDDELFFFSSKKDTTSVNKLPGECESNTIRTCAL